LERLCDYAACIIFVSLSGKELKKKTSILVRLTKAEDLNFEPAGRLTIGGSTVQVRLNHIATTKKK